ncbi:MAG: glycosyl hydrolase-related protein, partial [Defluviitaleaceae bacterium]|nr:glycosyl hydrolase-related protein [Defluviitaleaceae bacterium]
RELIVRCRLDYRERLKMLKLSFNVKADSPRAVYSMPFGFIEKQADGLEEPSHEWMAAIDEAGGAGLALVNDSKYSFSLFKNDMRMVAARGCGYADHYGSREDLVEYQDMGEQRFTYALSAFDAKRIEDVAKLAAVINQPPHLIMETRHEGPLAKRRSGIDVSAENVFVTAIKAAEPPLEGLILRVVETRGTETDATIKSGLFSQLVKVSLKRQEFMTIFVPSDPDREAFEICSDETFP